MQITLDEIAAALQMPLGALLRIVELYRETQRLQAQYAPPEEHDA